MSQTSGLLTSHRSLEVLQPNAKFTADPTLAFVRKRENGIIGREVSVDVHDLAGDMNLFDEDSPYGERIASLDSRPSDGDDGTESTPQLLPSVSPSASDQRWSDTTPYVSKKVLLASLSLFWNLLITLVS